MCHARRGLQPNMDSAPQMSDVYICIGGEDEVSNRPTQDQCTYTFKCAKLTNCARQQDAAKSKPPLAATVTLFTIPGSANKGLWAEHA